MVFQVRKTPVYCWDFGTESGFGSQSDSSYGYGAGHWCYHIGKIDQSDLAFESRLFAFGSFGDVLFALCLAHVYLGDFLSLRPDYAFTPIWAFYQDVAFFLSKVPNWGPHGPCNQWYQLFNPLGWRRCHVSRGCVYHSLGNPNHHVFQHFLADDTGGCLTSTLHGFCDQSFGPQDP